MPPYMRMESGNLEFDYTFAHGFHGFGVLQSSWINSQIFVDVSLRNGVLAPLSDAAVLISQTEQSYRHFLLDKTENYFEESLDHHAQNDLLEYVYTQSNVNSFVVNAVKTFTSSLSDLEVEFLSVASLMHDAKLHVAYERAVAVREHAVKFAADARSSMELLERRLDCCDVKYEPKKKPNVVWVLVPLIMFALVVWISASRKDNTQRVRRRD